MLKYTNLEDALKRFGKVVITQSRANLTRDDSNVTKKLYRSLAYNTRVGNNSFEFDFEMEQYGQFQDLGVSGTKKKYDTPYQFKKMPPSNVFVRWAKDKGIKPRNKDGRFMSYDTFGYLVARKKLEEGIKPKRFFSKHFEKHYPILEQTMGEYFAIDLEEFLRFTTKDIFK